MEKEGRKEGRKEASCQIKFPPQLWQQASKQSSNAASAVVYRTGTRIIHFGLCNGQVRVSGSGLLGGGIILVAVWLDTGLGI